MKSASEYRAHAEEAERMAKECRMPEARSIYEDIGRKYREMADQADRVNDKPPIADAINVS